MVREKLPAPAARPERLSDYRGYDFRAQWTQRANVTEVERALLAELLRSCDRRRVLEAAVGFGRLSSVLAAGAEEFVGLDLNETDLPAEVPETRRHRARWVVGNVYHLPFADGVFTTAVMVRLHHHLEYPTQAYAELHRVLAPGGQLIASFSPRPSLATLELDVKARLGPKRSERRPSITFARGGRVQAASDPFPVYVPSLEGAEQELRAAGFGVVQQRAPPPEFFERRMDPKMSIALSRLLAPLPWMATTRFVLARRDGDSPGSLPPWSDIIACPRCHERLEAGPRNAAEGSSCPSCHLAYDHRGPNLLARYSP